MGVALGGWGRGAEEPWRRGSVKEGSWEAIPEQSLEERSSRSETAEKYIKGREQIQSPRGKRELLYLYPEAFLGPAMGTVSPFSVDCPHEPKQIKVTL